MNDRQEKISGTVADGGAAGGGEKREKKIWPIHRRFVPPEGDDIIKAQELAERDGRGTIIEAIAILNNETGEFFNIEKAVRNGEIRSYAPGSCKPLGVPQKNLIAVLEEEEVYADDLNSWLKDKYPSVKFRFPEVGAGDTAAEGDNALGQQPHSKGAKKAPDPTVKQSAAAKAVTLQDVIANDWPINETNRFKQGSFRNALSDVPQWLEDAIVMRGKPGKSTLWNPAMIAFCLMTERKANRGALTTHIRNNFPDWLAEWEEMNDQ